MLFETVHGEKEIDLSVPHYEMGSYHKFPHWGWWVLWLLLFWPMLLVLAIVGLTRKYCVICVGKERKEYVMTEQQLQTFIVHKQYYNDYGIPDND